MPARGVLTVVATTMLTSSAAAGASDADALSALERSRIVFGHQSVGAGLVRGLERLAAASKVDLSVTDVSGAVALPSRGVAHALVGRNGDPQGKLAAFAALLERSGAAPPDVAALKFCYVDFGASTDVDALFSAYEATFRDLARRYPRTRFVHVTAPLTTVRGGWKGAVKALLGRPPPGFAENERREAFNEKLRAAYGPAVFDLARLEATTAAGATTTATWRGRTVLALPAEATTDGGHLAAAAEDRIARAFAVQLAANARVASR